MRFNLMGPNIRPALSASGEADCSRHGSGYMSRDSGWLASTNHFSTPELRDRWLEMEPPERRGNSQRAACT